MTLTHYGLREWGSAFVIMVLLLAGAWYLAFRMGCMRTGIAVAAVSVFLLLVIAAFFRNPCRRIPKNPLLIISPADGVIKDIVEVDEDKHEDEDDGEWEEGKEAEGEDKWNSSSSSHSVMSNSL